MYVYGTVNPVGENNGHKGIYLREQDIDDIVNSKQMYNKPILLEHKGDAVGRVISAWKNNNRLDCVFEINNSVCGLFAQHFVENKQATELSLGYSVEISNSDNEIKGGTKKVVEVSIVRKGARENCLIRGFTCKKPL